MPQYNVPTTFDHLQELFGRHLLLLTCHQQGQMQLRTVSEDGGMRMGLIVEGKRIPVMKFNVEPKTPPRQAWGANARTPIRITTVRGRTQVGRPNRFLARMPPGVTKPTP